MRAASAFVLSLVVLSGFLCEDAAAQTNVTFPHGVASGEVRSRSAVLWTRVSSDVSVTVEVSTWPTFKGGIVFVHTVAPEPDGDLTIKVLVNNLKPANTYFYRWRSGSAVSESGRFKTPRNQSSDLRFAFAGDTDGLYFPELSNFAVLDAVRLEDPDFWVYLGDTIYSDSSLKTQPSTAVEDYRNDYKLNRSIPALQDLMRSTSTYVVWDDHEVANDWDGETIETIAPGRFTNGRKAFFEYMPLAESDDGQPNDATCADAPLFRKFRWGRNVDLINLDVRSCRSGDAFSSCLTALVNGTLYFDFAPTLAGEARAAFRDTFRDFAGEVLTDLVLPEVTSQQCLDAINDPSRTMLGTSQKEAFKEALLTSTAKFKFVMHGVPLQQFWLIPYDRWEGYAHERAEILNFIRDNSIDNVIFATTDIHTNVINDVVIDTFTDPTPIAPEFATGPVASSVGGFFTFPPFQHLIDAAGISCVNPDLNSYALIDVDSSAGTATISLKDENGGVVPNQLDPLVECSREIQAN